MITCGCRKHRIVKSGRRSAESYKLTREQERVNPVVAWWMRELIERFSIGIRRLANDDLPAPVFVERAMDWKGFEVEASQRFAVVLAGVASRGVVDALRTEESAGNVVRKAVELDFDATMFDATQEAKLWADGHAAAMVTGIDEQTRDAIQRLVAEAIEEGVSGTKLADRLTEFVGMTDRQAAALDKYHQSLLDQGLPPGEVEKLLRLERKRKLEYRRRLIADTETAKARINGKIKAFEEAGITRLHAVLGSRPCPDCIELQFETYTPQEAADIYPVHPDCDCTLVSDYTYSVSPPNYNEEIEALIADHE